MMVKSEPHEPYRVLYLCSGNTCRSPMAEGVLRKLVEEMGKSAPPIESLSAGTLGLSGTEAALYSIDVCAEHGIDIRSHRSQPVTKELLDRVDLIMALAVDHLHYVLDVGIPEEKVYLVRAFPEQEGDLAELSIPDPIGGPREAYEQVFFQIDEALRRHLPDIIKRATRKHEA